MGRFEAKPDIVTKGLITHLDAGIPSSIKKHLPNTIEVLVVAGGGPGGGQGFNDGSGGGGAGGLIHNIAYPIKNTSPIPVTIGAGGGGVSAATQGSNGSNSVFGTLTAIGGGAGGSEGALSIRPGKAGGSGGGAGGYSESWSGGAGITSQGSKGGNNKRTNGGSGVNLGGGGGGGADQEGQPGSTNSGNTRGYGGDGLAYFTSGTKSYYAGGGGCGGGYGGPGGTGGLGGGGNGGSSATNQATGEPGNINTGGGGGGAGGSAIGGSGNSGNGGSGVVIIRYPGTPAATGGTITSVGGHTIHTFTSSGTFTPNKFKDLSGYNNDGILFNGVNLIPHQKGGFFEFDRTDDFIKIASANSGPLNIIERGNFTINFWASNTSGGAYRWMLSNWSSTGVHFGMNSDGSFGGYFGDNIQLNSDYIIPSDNSWHMYTALRVGEEIKLYVDAVGKTISGGANGRNGSLSAGVDTRIGSRGNNVQQLWQGNIAIGHIYNRVLSQQEINQNFNADRDRFGL